ncbi:pyridoxamine 5'-phosphate oxidase family protein [Halioxenophilus sp. WMMB6]|uniref:pyridoxamine 5'-phosphate oxidase family protein n=1 Tax=Halioxenophilus sp. WMMB6 TaxID=3073815 RepID=UPI00295EDA0B|nr:pyridoxamine 5'-phosphate oxidase family protein [Halioxenophilus sp. WMMB6]
MRLSELRDCLEGNIPSVIATCDHQGMANASYVSQAYYVDDQHLALTFQFFNKTHRNICENPNATLLIKNPHTAARYRLAIQYLRTEHEGALFEQMKARLNSIAHRAKMENTFVLKGADIYRVLHIETIDCFTLADRRAVTPFPLLLRESIAELAKCKNVEQLIETVATLLQEKFAISHALMLIREQAKLFTIHSFGYENSGIGSEIPIGKGVIGIAAQINAPIRITQPTHDYNYARLLTTQLQQKMLLASLETTIVYPGLSNPGSQLAVPLSVADSVRGILYLESPEPFAFDHQHEDTFVCLCQFFASCLEQLQSCSDTNHSHNKHHAIPSMASSAEPIQVRFIRDNASVFINNEYLIKGVAGSILWRLLNLYQQEQRNHFTNKEIRADSQLKLPELKDNLETRLILLRRRLAERTQAITIESAGRGAFRLAIDRPLQLIE